MAEQDPAVRLARALVDDLHGDLGAAFEEAAAKGEVASRFARELEAVRGTFGKRFDAAALGGRDPLGQALRDLVGKYGPADQVPLLVVETPAAAAAAPASAGPAAAPSSPTGSGEGNGGGDAAQVARLRAALREARRRVKRLEAENSALREELLSAGEMIETLALDLEKPVTE